MIPVFSELNRPENLKFWIDNRPLVELALRFGRSLEKLHPEWLQDDLSKRRLEIFPACGAVIARNALKVNLVDAIFSEHMAGGEKFSRIEGVNAKGLGRNYGYEMIRSGLRSNTEKALAEVYMAAVNGNLPLFLLREYSNDENGEGGFQDPHIDSGVRYPTIILGSGPGATRILNKKFEGTMPAQDDYDDEHYMLGADGATDLDVGAFDIGLFDGIRHLHGGMRYDTDSSDTEPRRVVAINVQTNFN